MSSYYYQPLPASDSPSSPNRRPFSNGRPYRFKFLQLRQFPFLVIILVLTFSLFSFHHTPHYALPIDRQALDPSGVLDDPFQSQPTLQPARGRIPHHSNIPNLSTSTKPQEVLEHVPPGPVTFSLIMFSEDSAAEGAVLIKSIIMYSSSPLAFHIVCDQDAEHYLRHRFRLLTHPYHDVTVHFYHLPHENMLARIRREGALHTDHSAGAPGLMKLFIHEILPSSVERAIFVDTDAFFISDPTQLWDHFNAFRPGAAISMPYHPDQCAPEWHNANRICSCIMLLDLNRLRELRLMDSDFYRQQQSIGEGPDSVQIPSGPPALAPPAFEAMFGAPVPNGDDGRMKYDNVKLGDQGYWWAIVSHRQEIFQPLSFDWEVSSCLVEVYGTGLGEDDIDEEAEARHQIHVNDTPDEGRAVLPKMLHFNCLDGTDRYYDWPNWTDPNVGLAQRWGPAVHYHVGFKWIWLNNPSSNATLTIEVLHDVKFADELVTKHQSGGQS